MFLLCPSRQSKRKGSWGSRLRFIISVPRLGIITSKPCRHSWRRGLSQVEHSIWATELIESGLSHTPSIEGMPESAQSEVAARPEAAEVPGEEKKTWISLNSSPTGYRGRRRSETSSSNSTQTAKERSHSTWGRREANQIQESDELLWKQRLYVFFQHSNDKQKDNWFLIPFFH